MKTKTKRLIQAEDLYRFEIIQESRLAPDGSRVVYTLQTVEQKTEKKFTNLWILPFSGGEPRRFTVGKHNDSTPRWSPDGKKIAFLSNRADEDTPPHIFLIPTDGGEACELADLQAEIESLAWSPDGRRLLCAARKVDKEELERQKDPEKKKLGIVDRHYDRLFYKLDGYGYLPHERLHIWVVDAASGKARQLTDHAVFDERDPAWSPDGKSIAFLSNRTPDPDMQPEWIDLFVMPAAGGEMRRIPTPVGEKAMPVWSPDGQWIAFYCLEGEGLFYHNRGLWVVPADGSQPARNLTDAYDLNTDPYTINDTGHAEVMPPTWSPDGKQLYFQADVHGDTLLMRIPFSGEAPETIIAGPGVVGSYTFDQKHEQLAYFYGCMTDPGQIYARSMSTNQARPLTRYNRDLLDGIDLGSIEEVWVPGAAGNKLQGWILKPPGFDPAKKYPSFLEIHGGPLTQYGHFFMHEFYYLAAHGYVIHFTNPRGGRGYGEAHAKAIYRDWGGADYDDLMAWSDYVSSLPYIDTGRMGVGGGSYGGYMTNWIIGHTQRFKAAVTMRSVSNFISMYGSSDFNWSFQYEIGDKMPQEDVETYWQHSPVRYLNNAKTPTLVIHNEMDHRCPIEQGEQVFVALRRYGVPSELVRFPNEFHGLSRTGRTDRRIARLNHILRWLDKYLV